MIGRTNKKLSIKRRKLMKRTILIDFYAPLFSLKEILKVVVAESLIIIIISYKCLFGRLPSFEPVISHSFSYMHSPNGVWFGESSLFRSQNWCHSDPHNRRPLRPQDKAKRRSMCPRIGRVCLSPKTINELIIHKAYYFRLQAGWGRLCQLRKHNLGFSHIQGSPSQGQSSKDHSS